MTQDKKPASDLTGKTIKERLEHFEFDTLKDDPDKLIQRLGDWAQDYWTIPEASIKDVYRDAVQKALKGVHRAPGGLIKNALADAEPEDAEAVEGGYTQPSNVIDLLNNEDEKSYLIKGPEIETDIGEESGWSLEKIREIYVPPEQGLVKGYLDQGVNSSELWGELKAWFKTKVVLPSPEDGWADLLTAWTLASHRHQIFNYFPLLFLPGEPERGKTRLGKATAYLSYRAVYTPSITPATVVRWRDWWGVTLLLDVGDVNVMLERGEMADLVLNSYEKDGRVSKVMHPELDPWDQVESFKVFGPTIVLSNHKLYRKHDNIRSRCIEITLPEAGHRVVPDAVTLRDEDTRDLYAKIVAYNALTYDSALANVDVPFGGRLEDSARPLLQIAQLANPGAQESIIEVLSKQDQKQKADNANSWEARVAISAWNCREKLIGNRLFISDLVLEVNKNRNDIEHLSSEQVGRARIKLGLDGGKGGAKGTKYINWPGDETMKAQHDRYFYKEPPDPPDPPENTGTKRESEQEDSPQIVQNLQITSSTENPQDTTLTGGSGSTGGTRTYMSRQDVPEDGYTDEVERESIQIEGRLN